MRRNIIFKIMTVSLVILMFFNCLIPNKVYASSEGSSGLDTYTGIILEPAVEFFSFFVDSIMSVFSGIMTQSNIEFVMQKNPINNTTSDVDADIVIIGEDLNPYKNILGKVSIKYPNFTYSTEEILSDKIDLLDIDFISGNNSDADWQKIRTVIAAWYKALRLFAMVGLLSVLIYTGIKIIISSNAKDKAKYKERIINWFIAFALLFVMHYIMAFILIVIEELSKLLGDINGLIKVNINGTEFTTNLIGFARFQMQQQHFSAKISYFVIYVALVVFTFKFTFLYLKRMLKMAFLTLIAPIVALTYPIDKMEGKAKGFDLWLKEYIYNVLLQPMQYLLYYILVSSSLTLAAKNPLYAIVAILFISQAEKMLKKIFGFDRAKGGTVGGIAGAYATGRIVTTMMNFIGGPSSKGKSSKTKDSSSSKKEEILPNDILEDTGVEDIFIPIRINENYNTEETQNVVAQTGDNNTNSNTNTTQNYNNNGVYIDKDLEEYRKRMEELFNSFSKLSFANFDSKSLEELFAAILESQERLRQVGYSDEEIQEINDEIFKDKKGSLVTDYLFGGKRKPFEYMDGDDRTNKQIRRDLLKNLEMLKDINYTDAERKELLRTSKYDMDKLNRRKLISGQDSQDSSINNTRKVEGIATTDSKTIKTPRVIKGIENVGKTMLKPVVDTDKSVTYNVSRILKKAAKGATGFAVGAATATVQAGISITDGKYNVMEGVASFAGGAVGGASAVEAVTNIRKSLKADETIEEYSARWYDRDDVIHNYNKQYPDRAKELRKRARDEYVSRGIVDFKEQKQVIKFADSLIKDGVDQKEADRIAVATLQYKQTLIKEKNYSILYDQKRLKKYLDTKEEYYTGKASKTAIRNQHMKFIENVRTFDKLNG